MKFDVNAVVYQEGKHHVAQCLDVDVSSFGDSEAKSLDNLKEALELYFEDAEIPKTSVEHPAIKKLTLQSA